jgi:poly-gamma-glutamate synthesis protein (capsule biosynthesis protein)
VLSYDGGKLRTLELTPISLGWKDARHRRGRPRLAEGEEGRSILARFAELSRPFGTEFGDDGRAVRLG